MSAPKWTPGPWLRAGTTVYALDEVRGMYLKGQPVEANRIYFQVGTSACLASTEEMEATAILAQHAPELYDALGKCVHQLQCLHLPRGPHNEAIVAAVAALKLARGEA